MYNPSCPPYPSDEEGSVVGGAPNVNQNDNGNDNGDDSPLSKGLRYARMAIHYDQQNDLESALSNYQNAIQHLISAKEGGEYCDTQTLEEKIQNFITRTDVIHNLLTNKDSTGPSSPKKPESDLLTQAYQNLDLALELDASKKSKEAINRYLDAAELCLKAKKATLDESIKSKLSKLADEALSRAEHLTGREKASKVDQMAASLNSVKIGNPSSSTTSTPTKQANEFVTSRSSLSEKRLKIVGPSSYSKEELAVMKRTSKINRVEYLPFLAVDLGEKFHYVLSFTDSNGYLSLSDKQKSAFSRWARLEEISSDPKLIRKVDCFSIKQELISDCSFIASLTVAALYESRFKKKLITNIIYPQNSNHQPVYNPSGKYMIKLHVNGLDRKVIIDDYLPVDQYKGLLCSHSVNSDEFWVSLLEKAYMKLMGGYDFPGSNSCIDLNALTGWIPERLCIRNSLEKIFSSLVDRYNRGDVLITMGTGDLSKYDEERSGLVPNHAYAVLDVREVDGHKLMLLKNPWRHLSWKGKFSDQDDRSWTSSLQQKLNYDPKVARHHDNGVFWIDTKSVSHFFEALFLNWKCSLFNYTFCTHGCWHAGQGPAKDVYTISENPQFHLNVHQDNSSVWVLLTRHIVEKHDFAENKEFITILVYKGCEKIYIPYSPGPFINGERINSPHYLCKIRIPAGGSTDYVLIVSQFEKTTTIFYTLRVYSTVPFSMTKLEEKFDYVEKITDASWDDSTAGGCPNNRLTYPLNPAFLLEVNGPDDATNEILIDLKGPKEYNIGLEVSTQTLRNPNSSFAFKRLDSGSYKNGYTILKLHHVPQGTYTVIPATFNPGQKGPFFLTVKATCPIKLERIK
ncbi:calpain-7-like [Brevipalpus obovatus]|uniref:calpain-7-like n=1 Tax=Brevipalpus obovatus TaxID=246614 RepID=UPI003D9F63E6